MKLKKLVSALVACAMILGTMAAVPVFAEESTGTNPVEEFMSLKAQSVNETHKIDLNGATVNITEPYYSNIYADITIKNGTINFSDFTTSDGIFRIGYWSCDHPVTLTLENMIINVTNVKAYTGVFTMQNQDDTLVLKNSTINATGIKDTPGIFYTANGENSVRGSVEITGGRLSVETDSALFFNNDVDLNGTTISCTVDRPVFRQSAGSVEDTTITVERVIDGATRGIVEDIAGNPDGTVEFKNSKVVAPEGQTFVKANTTGKVLAIADIASTYTVGETVNLMASEETGVKLIVASINGKSYATLADAVAAAQNGETVTLLRDAEGDGVSIMAAEAKNITIDLGGNTYTVSGGAVGSTNYETQGFHLEKGSNITIKNGTITSTANSGVLMLVQNYCNLTLDGVTLDGTKLPTPSGWPYGYVMSNNCGDVLLKGNTSIIAKADDVAFDSCKNGSYSIPTVTVETTGTINGNIELTGGNLIVKSGTFTSDVADYVAEGYYQKDNGNGTYTVLPVEAKVIDTAKTTGATVTLDNLNKNTVVDPAADATYKVVVSTPSTADADAANKAIASNNDTNTSKAMFDISVVKTDSNGVETDLGGTKTGSITNQPVTLTLGETPVENSVKVYHVESATSVKKITKDDNSLEVSGNKVSFIAPSFSNYAITYTATTPTAVAGNVGVVFSPVSQGSNQYYINLKSLDGKPINRFMSTDLVFKNRCADVDYDITPAANMTASVVSEKVNDDNTKSREYRFNMDGKTLSSATGTGITIGTITFYGYGTLDFSVDTLYSPGHAVNIVNTAKIANNIVDNYMVSGGTLIVNEAANKDAYPGNIADDEYGVIKNVTLAPATKDLTVNIAYNNKINNNAAAYQDMTVTISGGDLNGAKTVELGETAVKSGFANNANVTVEYDDVNSAYTVKVAKELTQNVAYTVTVEGAGYRTARYTVKMTANKTLNFWNNVKDAEENIETGVGTPSKTNFLAGDIVKDNNINIYDLSAVVSYFGENELINDNGDANAYAKYDLNRDGVIDSKDVAYVLVSWGE